MKHLWQIAVYETSRNVFKKGFLLTALSIPFFVTFSLCVGLLLEGSRKSASPVGFVDQAGVIVASGLSPETQAGWAAQQEHPSPLYPFASENEARAALDAGKIQVYFLLPSGYLENRHVYATYTQRPSEHTWRQFFDFLQLNLAASQPPEISYRLAAGSVVTVRSMDGRREYSRAGPTFGLMMPLFITMAFLFSLLISSGYMMSAVTEEKENRTLEVILTSVSPFELMAGKILGITATSLTLLLTWAIVLAVGVNLASQAGIDWFNNLAMDWRTVLVTVFIAIPAYVLAAAFMITIGVITNTTQEAQPVSTIFTILHLLPLYISVLFVLNPHHPIGVILSLLPFTALVTTGMRNLFIIVPTWQVIASVGVQTTCALGAILLAGRALRIGMLHTGQKLNWRVLFRTSSPTERV